MKNNIEKPLIETTNDNGSITVKEHNNVGLIAARVYFVMVIAFMFAVYIWSFAINIVGKNANQIVRAVVGFVPVFLCALVLIIIVFDLWHKLFSIIFRKKKTTDIENPKDESILYEKLYIYRDYIRLEQNGSVQEAQISSIVDIEIEQDKYFYLIFFNMDNDAICASLPKRSALLKRIKKIFDCPVRIVNTEIEDNDKMSKKDYVGGIVMSLFAVAVGTVLVVMHYLGYDVIPVFLGIMFIAGGSAVFVGVVFRKSKLENVLVPILFAVIIIALFVGLSLTYMDELQISFVQVFVAQPYMVSVIGLCGCALYLVFTSVLNLIDIIAKRLKTNK